MGWIGVDLDGTLAFDKKQWDGGIGEPIPRMLSRVKGWIKSGKDVRIMTARVGMGAGYSAVSNRYDDAAFVKEQIDIINQWCIKHIGRVLPITASKDFAMIELWDDRAVQVIPNSGVRVDGGA